MRCSSGGVHRRHSATTHALGRVKGLRGRCCQRFRRAFTSVVRGLGRRGVRIVGSARLAPRRRRFVASLCQGQLGKSAGPLFLAGASHRASSRASRSVCLTVHLLHGSDRKGIGVGSCTIVKLPATRFKHFVHLPSSRNGACLVFLSSIVHCYLPVVFVNVGCAGCRTCAFGFAGSTRVRVSDSLHANILRGVSGKVGDQGQNRPVHFICSGRVPGSLLQGLASHLGISGGSAHMTNKHCRGFGSLVGFPSYKQSSLGCPT